jgi:hypothetical protein
MKVKSKTFLLSILLVLPDAAFAQPPAKQKAPSGMSCPMMESASTMEKNMGAMMKNMHAMMTSTSDAAMKPRMQMMHSQMAMMMISMHKMGGDMGSMMVGPGMHDEQDRGTPSSAPPPAAAENHSAHHPKQ